MQLPQLQKTKDVVSVVSQFGGVNKGLHIAENEFYDMSNITNDYYPVLSTRKKRGIIDTLERPQALLGGNKVAYVDNDKLYFNFELIKELEPLRHERILLRMGAYICVFPDGYIYNTSDGSEQYVRNKTESTTDITVNICKLDGTDFTEANTHIGTTAPTDNKIYWLDTSGTSVVLKMYSSSYSMWTSVGTTYVKIAATGIGKGFKPYDAVDIQGINATGYNGYEFNGIKIVYGCEDDYIIIAGLSDLIYTQEAKFAVTVERKLPDMEYMCELDNRLWGCNSATHEIYACKLGDPTNWNAYAGLDSDSYAVTSGSAGDFTGIAAYGGYVYVFKEDGFHKLYGTKPSNYEMAWKPCRGVQKGCDKSIAIVSEVMFYKSRDAVCAYDGATEVVSAKIDTEPYYEAVACGYRNKYYVSMRDGNFKWRMYVYDITKGTWTIEDDVKALFMAYADNSNFVITKDKKLLTINNEVLYTKFFPQQTELGIRYLYPIPEDGYEGILPSYAGSVAYGLLEDNIDWFLETGDLCLDNPYNKYVKRFNIRLQLENKTKLKIEIEYDTSGVWEYVGEYNCTHKRSYELPIAVRRADHIRIRLSGTGDFKLYSIAKTVEGGSGEGNNAES